jgi:hypothetical protein
MPHIVIGMEYTGEVYEYNAERELAISVIVLAVKDYVRSISGLGIGKIRKTVRNQFEMVRDECFSFLTGKTEIARHWFHQSGLRFFSENELSNPSFANDFYKRLTGQVWDRTPAQPKARPLSPYRMAMEIIRKNKKKIAAVKPRQRAGYILELSRSNGLKLSEMTVMRAMKVLE